VRDSITLKMIALLWIIWFIQLFVNGEEYVFGFVPSKALHEPWMFVTSMFLHDDTSVEHVFFNTFALLIFGPYLERLLTRKQYLMLFFAAGIAGNIAYFFINRDPNIPAIGASGAIYGMIGTLAILRPTLMIYLYYVPIPLLFAALIFLIKEFIGIFVPSPIASQAHLAGLLLGMVYGYYLKKKGSYIHARFRRPKRYYRQDYDYDYYYYY